MKKLLCVFTILFMCAGVAFSQSSDKPSPTPPKEKSEKPTSTPKEKGDKKADKAEKAEKAEPTPPDTDSGSRGVLLGKLWS